MDVDTGISNEKSLPTDQYDVILDPELPVVRKKAVLDVSMEDTLDLITYPEPGDLQKLAPTTFVINSKPGYVVDLSSLEIDLKLQIYNARNLVDSRADFVGYLCNNLSNSIFKSIKVSLNDVIIESNYHGSQLSRLNHLLTTCDEVSRSVGKPFGVFQIKHDLSTLNVTDDRIKEAKRSERLDLFKQDTIHVRGPLNLGILALEKYIPDGVKVSVVVEFQNPEFIINSKVATNAEDKIYKYRIQQIKLRSTLYKPADYINLSIQKELTNSYFEYLMPKKLVSTHIVSGGVNEVGINRPYQQLVPNYIYCWFTDLQADNGAYDLDPFFWDDLGLDSYTVMLDGREIFSEIVNGNYVDSYLACSRAHAGGDQMIPYAKFSKGCFLLIFDMSKSTGSHNTIKVERSGNLRFHFKFKNNLLRPARIYLVGDTDVTFQIDSDRNVTTNFIR